MVEEKKLQHLIAKAVRSRGLYAKEHCCIRGEDAWFNVDVVGIERTDMFEFFWYLGDREINCHLIFELGDANITKDVYKKIQYIFSKEKTVFQGVSMDQF